MNNVEKEKHNMTNSLSKERVMIVEETRLTKVSENGKLSLRDTKSAAEREELVEKAIIKLAIMEEMVANGTIQIHKTPGVRVCSIPIPIDPCCDDLDQSDQKVFI